MKYLSVCSGIEAATVAWHPLGWTPWAFAQFDPDHDYARGPDFPSAVLAHHYGSNVPGEPWSGNAPPNLGDMTRFQEWPDAAIDLLVGGTPCQDFSIAGLRAGMDGIRGSLTLVYAAIARRYRPRWLAWENVPGVLSSHGGRDFASLLGLLSGRRIEIPAGGWRSAGIVESIDRAYGLAWRVLDAQFVRVDGFGRAVPQRRRRVFIVGYLGDWRRGAAVLFERASLCGHPAPRRQSRQDVAGALSARTKGGGGLGTDFELDNGLIVAGGGIPDQSMCLNAGGMGRIDAETETLIPMLMPRGGFFDASEDGTGRGTPLVPVIAPAVAQTLTRGAESSGKGGYAGRRQEDDTNIVAFAENTSAAWAVRRLMPVECERLQGFPDGYTAIPFRGKPAADGPRYKALGNSMAVNCMRWLGQRIKLVQEMADAKNT